MQTPPAHARTAGSQGPSLLHLTKAPSLNVKSVKFVPAEGDTENGPDYRVFAAAVEFGAAWKKQSDKGNSYLSVKLDDPSFAAPIYASLVETEGDELALIWSRRRVAS